MERVDQWILGFYERFSHRFQRLTGLNNFWLVRVAIGAHALAYVLFAITPLRPGISVPHGALDFRFFLCAITGVVVMLSSRSLLNVARMMEEHYERGSNTAHPTTMLWRGAGALRLLYAAVIIALGVGLGESADPASGAYWLFQVAWCQVVSGLYFMAVIPLPPSRNTVQRLLDNIRLAFARRAPVRESR